MKGFGVTLKGKSMEERQQIGEAGKKLVNKGFTKTEAKKLIDQYGLDIADKSLMEINKITKDETSISVPQAESKKKILNKGIPTFPQDPKDRTRSMKNIIEKVSKSEGVNPNIMLTMAKVESGFNPIAKAKSTSASGVMQMTKAAFKDVGMDWERRFEPEYNIKAAAKYYKLISKRVGSNDPKKVVGGYYAGAANVKKAIAWAERTGKSWLDAPSVTKQKPTTKQHLKKAGLIKG